MSSCPHRLARLVAVSALAMAWLGAGVASGQSSSGPSLEYRAPAECPAREELAREFAGRLGAVDGAAREGMAFAIDIVRTEHGYRGTVAVLAPAKLISERQIADADCREVVRAAAFIAAVLTSPEAEPVGTAAPPAPPPSPPPPVVAPISASGSETGAPPPPAPVPPARRAPSAGPHPYWAFLAWVGLGLETATAPRAPIGPRMGIGLRGRQWLAPALRLSVARFASSTLRTETGNARLVLLAGRADGCLALLLDPQLDLLGCAALEAGTLRGRGQSELGTRTQSAPWLAPGLRLRVARHGAGPLWGYAEGGVAAPIVRPTFYFQAADGPRTVHEVRAASFDLELGLALRFP